MVVLLSMYVVHSAGKEVRVLGFCFVLFFLFFFCVFFCPGCYAYTSQFICRLSSPPKITSFGEDGPSLNFLSGYSDGN